MIELVSEKLRSTSCFQISNERYNAALYLYIAGFLKNKGLDNLAEKFFVDGWEQENNHAKQIFDFLCDLSAKIDICQVDGIQIDINTIQDIGQLFLKREEETTLNLEELKKIAINDGNSVAEEFYREMIKQQREEYAEATGFYDNAILCNDWFQVKIWNDSLGD